MFILLAFILFCLMLLGLYLKQYQVMILSYIVYVVLYDWIFLSISFEFSSPVILLFQLSPEIITALIFLLTLVRSQRQGRLIFNKHDLMITLCVIAPMFISCLVSLSLGDGISNVITGLRLYFMPIIIPYFMYRGKMLNKLSIKPIIYVLAILALFNVVYAMIQYYSFNGDLSELWCYQYGEGDGEQNAIDKSSFNFIRNDKLRAIGVFVSSITLTTFFATVMILSVINLKKILSIPIAIILLYGIYLTQTRVGFVAIFLMIGLICFKKIFRKAKLGVMITIPIMAIVFTFGSIFIGNIDDLSALGRIIQYAKIPELFTLIGYGVGNEEHVLVRFDSLYISVLMAMGVFSIGYLYYFIYISRIIYGYADKLSYSVSLFAISCLYLFAFQFMAGSATFKILFLLIYIIIAQHNEKRTINSSL